MSDRRRSLFQTWPRILSALILLYATSVLAAMADPGSSAASLRIGRMRCEYQDCPLGIDHPAPRLSWTLTSSVRGQSQTAYRVLVADSLDTLQANRGTLWDSGKVASGKSVNIEYAGRPLVPAQRAFWKVMVWDREGRATDWSTPARWEMGLLRPEDWRGRWIYDGKPLPKEEADFYQDDPSPLFRREFRLTGPIRAARLYISGLGYYQASLNGETVGNRCLDPLWTRVDKRVFYSTYDVTGQLKTGTNCLGVSLGNGWYNPLPLRMWGRINLREHLPVGRPRFLAQLDIEYADGSHACVVSDSHWRCAPGPILRNSIYLGEKYDARHEISGWNQPGFDDRTWAAALEAPAPGGALQAEALPPIQVTRHLKPVRITEPSPGVYIADMGQNFGGWARFTFDVPRGTRISLRYGELLYPNGTLNPMTSVCGQIKGKPTAPDQSGPPGVAWQADTYIAKGGGSETYTPPFYVPRLPVRRDHGVAKSPRPGQHRRIALELCRRAHRLVRMLQRPVQPHPEDVRMDVSQQPIWRTVRLSAPGTLRIRR